MTHINLGTTSISATQYAVQRNVILGTCGSGKTHTAKFMAECLMMAGIPIVIIDPLGNWRYLNTMKDASNKPFDIIVVGKNGDVALDVDTIEEVVRQALVNRLSIVIDLFDVDNLDNWHEVVSKVMTVLLYENQEHGLRHVFIEEAAEFVHQQGKKTESSVSIERLARMAGNVKVGMTFVNQTSEQLSKAVLKLCDGKFLGRQTESNTIKTIRRWIADSGVANATEIAEGMPSLKAGQFWAWSTEDNTPTLTKIPDILTVHPNRNLVTAQDIRHGKNKDDVVNALRKLTEESTQVSVKDMGEISNHSYTYHPEAEKKVIKFNARNYLLSTIVTFAVFAVFGLGFEWYAIWTLTGWFFFQEK